MLPCVTSSTQLLTNATWHSFTISRRQVDFLSPTDFAGSGSFASSGMVDPLVRLLYPRCHLDTFGGPIVLQFREVRGPLSSEMIFDSYELKFEYGGIGVRLVNSQKLSALLPFEKGSRNRAVGRLDAVVLASKDYRNWDWCPRF
jgi:hypothetical protein